MGLAKYYYTRDRSKYPKETHVRTFFRNITKKKKSPKKDLLKDLLRELGF